MYSNDIDAICQYNKDGTIIPIKIRVQDENGELQIYTILSSRMISKGTMMLPNEVVVTESILRFACAINVFGCEKNVILHYDKRYTKWSIYY